jgi:hypothetical protein
LLFGLVPARPAQAQADAAVSPVHAALVWERGRGAESCISPGRLTRALENQLGYTLFADAPALLVHGQVSKVTAGQGTRFRADVTLMDREHRVLGRRAVETPGSDCNTLDDALVLVLALAVDAQVTALAVESQAPATAQPEPAAPAPEPGPPPRPEPEPPPQRVTPPPPPPPQPTPPGAERREPGRLKILRTPRAGSSGGLVLAIGGGLSTGLMPALTWGAALTLGIRTTRGFGLEVAALAFPSGRAPTSEGAAEFRAGYAELRGCAPLWQKLLVVDACVGLWNGMLRAHAEGFDKANYARLSPLSGATGQLRVAWGFADRLFARASFGFSVPFVRDRFVVEGSGGTRVELHRSEPWMTLALLDVGLRLR